MVKLRLAGVASMLPAVSIARTWKLCAPAASAGLTVRGEVQAAKAALSTLHWKLAVASGELKLNVGVVSFVGVGSTGPPVKAVFGGVRSTVKLRTAGLASMLPAVSIARTRMLCAPAPSAGETVCGEVQAAKAALSTLHWKVAVASLGS